MGVLGHCSARAWVSRRERVLRCLWVRVYERGCLYKNRLERGLSSWGVYGNFFEVFALRTTNFCNPS